MNAPTPATSKRAVDTTTLDHLIELTKLANRYSRALINISEIDGSDAETDLRIARRLAREALFPEGELPRDENH